MESPLPPILVHRRTMRVIDGMHRLKAALMRGRETIEARFFEGPDDAAFLLAVRENIKHGLPLSTADREMAAARILASQPHWSDRAIAAVAGLSTRAVAAIRVRSTDAAAQLNARMGRDGRMRPLDGAEGRLRASDIINDRPDLSLRQIAREAGISLSTARDVRQRIRQGRDPLPAGQRNRQDEAQVERPHQAPSVPAPRPPSDVSGWPSVRQKMNKDPALRYNASGRTFLHWFDAHAVDASGWKPIVDAVPPHWRDEIAALARLHAERWLEIAKTLDRQSKRTA
ncbi:ParB/RepB/Spo0J family partition protein [Actinoallomurus acanthiterrae]